MKVLTAAALLLTVSSGAFAQDENPFMGPTLTDQQQFLCSMQQFEFLIAMLSTADYISEDEIDPKVNQFVEALEVRRNSSEDVERRLESAVSEENSAMKIQMYQGMLVGSVDKKQTARAIVDTASDALLRCVD